MPDTGWTYTHDRDAELIRRDGLMCEAHPGLEFGHNPECAGPGMAWVVEGREQIRSLSDFEQLVRLREVAGKALGYIEHDPFCTDHGKQIANALRAALETKP